MKRISTLFMVLMALMALPLTAGAAETVFDFENNPQGWPVGEGVNFADGNLTTPLVVDEVTLTNVQGNATQPARIMKANDGISALYVYKNGSIQLSVADGRAITKIEVTMKTGSFDLVADNGSVADNVWTGNAQQVLFTASATRQMLKLVITSDAANDETVKPVVETFDVEAADIAAFNAVEDGKVVKLTLKDAQVNGCKFNDYYVEDASGATVFKGVTLTVGDVLNGYIIGTKSTDANIDYKNDPAVAVEYQLTATDASTFTAEPTVLMGTPMTIGAACQQVSYGRLVTLTDVSISGGGQNKTMTDAEGNTMKARDYMGVLSADYTWPEKAAKITGVVIYYMTGWFLMPISAEAIVEAGTQEETVFDFALNNMSLPIGQNGADSELGNLAGKAVTMGDVTLTFVNSPTLPTRYYNMSSRGNMFQMIANGQLRLTAAEGRAITSIVVKPNYTTNAATGAIVTNVSWTVDKGEGTLSTDKMTWTGNAASVRFTGTGATYLDSIIVVTAPADASTVTSEGDVFTEVASIAEFNALTTGTLAKLQLSDAIVSATALGPSRWTIYVQDATAGAHMYCMPFELKANDVLNGVLYVVKSDQTAGSRMAMTEKTSSADFTVTANGTVTPVEGTIAEVNVAANINRVVKVSGVQFAGTSATAATLTDIEGATITVNNTASGMSPYVITDSFVGINYERATVVGILYGMTKGNSLYPLSITEDVITDGIADSQVSSLNSQPSVFNLQGLRLNRLQKGLNIVGGKKVLVK